jgi:hypothetical protein
MKVVSTSKGVISEMYAGDAFGEGGLLEESHLRKMSVLAQEYPVAVLRIDKLHYDRYIKSFHAKEKARREAVFREVSVLDDLGKEAKGALLHTMVTHRFKIGERLVVEGSLCTSLMFISSGHCRVTKQVPTPRGEEEVELGAFYSGSCLAAEATLGRGRCAYTVTAMSLVVAETLDAALRIFCDHPVIGGRAQALLRAAESAFLLRPRTQAILNGAHSLRRWREYKAQLSDHIVRRRRRELRRDADRFSRPLDPASPADPDDADAPPPRRSRGGEGLPELGPPDRRAPRVPRDGRWPFFQPLVDRSAASRRMAALAADTGVLLKDHTFV